jgi:hypothetical protein
VPPVVAQTPVERRRQHEATIRRQTRMEHRRAIRQHREEVAGPAAAAHEDDGSPPHLRI